jgi:hypothetical protein
MLNENELLEDLAREIGVLFINCRTADLNVEKLTRRVEKLEQEASDREHERGLLLERLKKAEDGRTQLAREVRGKNKN